MTRHIQPGGWFGQSDAFTDHALLPDVDPAELLRRHSHSHEAFVLLDDQSRGRCALFSRPRRLFIADTLIELPAMLEKVGAALSAGAELVGYLAYAAGAAFDILGPAPGRYPAFAGAPHLLWFAEFERREDFTLCSARAAHRASCRAQPAISRVQYEEMVRAALHRIRQGDIYQVNLTFPAALSIRSADELYCATRQGARAPFGAFINDRSRQILSFSPELLFSVEDGTVRCRPMKGTRPRGASASIDQKMRHALSESAKDRAENLMIVDLLRNDLSRVCRAGSVAAPRLFDIEAYPTVWQMTSGVSGRLRPGLNTLDVLKALFPCGSITGAPKIMASRVIADLEIFDRGIYTGAIGILREHDAVLNVAIRTIETSSGVGRLDLGAGIVADSDPGDEWRECLVKSRFLERR